MTNRKEQLQKLERIFLEKRGKEWPFVALIKASRSRMRNVYEETLDSIVCHAIANDSSDSIFLENIEQGLSFIYDFNHEVKHSLGIESDDNYTGFWESRSISEEHIQKLPNQYLRFPKNLYSFASVVNFYLKNKAIQSNTLDQLLVDFIVFAELNAVAFQLLSLGVFRSSSLIEKLFNKEKVRAKVELLAQARTVWRIYLQCSPTMFNPKVVYEMALDLRKRVDFFEGILFDLLEAQIYRRSSASTPLDK
jgi:hypothetical protein